MRRCYAHCRALLIIVLIAWTCSPALGESAQEVFDQLFKEELDRVRATPGDSDDLETAAMLLRSVDKARHSPELAHLMCDQAFDLAAFAADGYDIAIAALDAYPTTTDPQKSQIKQRRHKYRLRLLQSARGDLKTKVGQDILDDALPSVTALIESGKFAEARDTLGEIEGVARAIRSPRLARIADLRNQVEHVARQQRLAENLQQRVDGSPSGRAVRERLIRIYALELGRTADAAKLIDPMVEVELARHVKLLPDDPSKIDIAPLLDHADWLRSTAGEPGVSQWARIRLLQRALAGYNSVLDRYEGGNELTRTRAQLAIAQINRQLGDLQPANASIINKIDLQKATFDGKWQKKGGTLYATAEAMSGLALPDPIESDYKLKLDFTVAEGAKGPFVVLPVAQGKAVMYVFGAKGGRYHGLEVIDNKRSYENETTRKLPVVPHGRKTSLEIDVKYAKSPEAQVTITVHVNGRQIIAWSGKPTQTAVHRYYQKAPVDRIGVIAQQKTALSISAIEFEAIPSP